MTTTALDKDVADVLNTLLETATDGEFGFAQCAERAIRRS